jgi:hypothetical protein
VDGRGKSFEEDVDDSLGVTQLRVELVSAAMLSNGDCDITVSRKACTPEEETLHAQFEDGEVREQVVLPIADLRLEVLLHPRQVARVIPVCRVSIHTYICF